MSQEKKIINLPFSNICCWYKLKNSQILDNPDESENLRTHIIPLDLETYNGLIAPVLSKDMADPGGHHQQPDQTSRGLHKEHEMDCDAEFTGSARKTARSVTLGTSEVSQQATSREQLILTPHSNRNSVLDVHTRDIELKTEYGTSVSVHPCSCEKSNIFS